MDPDRGAILNFRVSDPSTRTAHRPIKDDIGSTADDAGARLHLALIAIVALVSMAMFFYGALRLTKHVQQFNFRPVVESEVDAMERSVVAWLP